MKTQKLIIGIISILCSVFSPYISITLLPVNSFTIFLISALLLSSGIIAITTRKSKSIITDIIPAVFYLLVGLIFIQSYIFVYLQYQTSATIFIVLMFTTSLIFILSLIDKLKQKKQQNKIQKIYANFKKCAYCNTVTTNAICPQCSTPIDMPIDKALINNGFVIGKVFNGVFCSLFIDDKNKKWCVYNKLENSNKGIYSYNDIIKADLSIIQNSAPNLNQCTDMSVIVYLNNLNISSLVIDIIKQPVNTNTKQYEDTLSFARELISTFEYMKNKTK